MKPGNISFLPLLRMGLCLPLVLGGLDQPAHAQGLALQLERPAAPFPWKGAPSPSLTFRLTNRSGSPRAVRALRSGSRIRFRLKQPGGASTLICRFVSPDFTYRPSDVIRLAPGQSTRINVSVQGACRAGFSRRRPGAYQVTRAELTLPPFRKRRGRPAASAVWTGRLTATNLGGFRIGTPPRPRLGLYLAQDVFFSDATQPIYLGIVGDPDLAPFIAPALVSLRLRLRLSDPAGARRITCPIPRGPGRIRMQRYPPFVVPRPYLAPCPPGRRRRQSPADRLRFTGRRIDLLKNCPRLGPGRYSLRIEAVGVPALAAFQSRGALFELVTPPAPGTPTTPIALVNLRVVHGRGRRTALCFDARNTSRRAIWIDPYARRWLEVWQGRKVVRRTLHGGIRPAFPYHRPKLPPGQSHRYCVSLPRGHRARYSALLRHGRRVYRTKRIWR